MKSPTAMLADVDMELLGEETTWIDEDDNDDSNERDVDDVLFEVELLAVEPTCCQYLGRMWERFNTLETEEVHKAKETNDSKPTGNENDSMF